MKKNNKKGFTLAELLIVVAIIAVLVAIAIPVFTTQLEKSRDSVSVSNMRAAYAESQALLLAGVKTGETAGNATLTINEDGTKSVAVTNIAIKSQNVDSWSNLAEELPFTKKDGTKIAVADPGKAGTSTMTFSYDALGNMTSVVLSDPA